MRLRTWPETEATCRVKLVQVLRQTGKRGSISKFMFSKNRFHLVRTIQWKRLQVQCIRVPLKWVYNFTRKTNHWSSQSGLIVNHGFPEIHGSKGQTSSHKVTVASQVFSAAMATSTYKPIDVWKVCFLIGSFCNINLNKLIQYKNVPTMHWYIDSVFDDGL